MLQPVVTRIRRRGVLVVPKAVRERLRLEAGTIVEFVVQDDGLLLRKKDLWAKFLGASKGAITPAQAEAELDEAE